MFESFTAGALRALRRAEARARARSGGRSNWPTWRRPWPTSRRVGPRPCSWSSAWPRSGCSRSWDSNSTLRPRMRTARPPRYRCRTRPSRRWGTRRAGPRRSTGVSRSGPSTSWLACSQSNRTGRSPSGSNWRDWRSRPCSNLWKRPSSRPRRRSRWPPRSRRWNWSSRARRSTWLASSTPRPTGRGKGSGWSRTTSGSPSTTRC